MIDHEDNAFQNKDYRDAVWKEINARIDESEKVKKMPRMWMRYAAAAILLITGSLLVFKTGNKPNSPDRFSATLDKIVNTTDNIYQLKMEDGSRVTLYPNSEIVYQRHFSNHERDVHLKGKAFFEVAHDKTRPFSVYANSLITTALGTSFTVVSDSLLNEVNVFLYTGKVVVRQNTHGSKKVYLAPGEQISWNIHSGTSIVKLSHPVIKPSSPPSVKKLNRKSPRNFTLVFDQEPLPDVLKKIGSGFTIHLNYYPAELSSLYFSGTVKSTDQPTRILQRIADLHHLSLTPDKRGYTIRKLD